MNNEFGEDLVLSSSRVKKRVNKRGGRSIPKTTSFTTKAEPGLMETRMVQRSLLRTAWAMEV